MAPLYICMLGRWRDCGRFSLFSISLLSSLPLVLVNGWQSGRQHVWQLGNWKLKPLNKWASHKSHHRITLPVAPASAPPPSPPTSPPTYVPVAAAAAARIFISFDLHSHSITRPVLGPVMVGRSGVGYGDSTVRQRCSRVRWICHELADSGCITKTTIKIRYTADKFKFYFNIDKIVSETISYSISHILKFK